VQYYNHYNLQHFYPSRKPAQLYYNNTRTWLRETHATIILYSIHLDGLIFFSYVIKNDIPSYK